jgi:hypothetical protein
MASASLLSVVSARIVGIRVPDTIKPGDSFNAFIETANFSMPVYDVAIVFGVKPNVSPDNSTGLLGQVMASFALGPCKIAWS